MPDRMLVASGTNLLVQHLAEPHLGSDQRGQLVDVVPTERLPCSIRAAGRRHVEASTMETATTGLDMGHQPGLALAEVPRHHRALPSWLWNRWRVTLAVKPGCCWYPRPVRSPVPALLLPLSGASAAPHGLSRLPWLVRKGAFAPLLACTCATGKALLTEPWL
jgi:hypothetical protein